MNRKNSLLEIHLAVLLFGFAGLFGKWIVLSPVVIVFGRVFFASITLALINRFTSQNFKILPRKNYALLFFLGFILSIHWISFFKSIQVSTVAVGLLSFSSFPIFTVLLEPLFFKEKLVKSNILYAVLCLAGIYLIIPHFDLANSIYQGVLWGLVSGLTFSILTILNRSLSQKYPGLTIAFFQDFFAMLILLPLLLILLPSPGPKDIFLLLILGVFCTAISHTLFIRGMKYVKAQTASIINSLEPLYGIILAFLFLGEIPSFKTILGGTIILGTAFIVTVKARQRKKIIVK